MTTLDRNGQPLANYNANRNRDKLLNNLMGILTGSGPMASSTNRKCSTSTLG